MTGERKRYLMQSKAHDDKQQLKFGAWGNAEQPHPPKIDVTFTIDVMMQVSCPFCLYSGKLQTFLISTNKGINQHTGQCPECKLQMRMKSLTEDMTPEQYAQWVFEYIKYGFWKKCSFSIWKKRLKDIGWAKPFWDKYKELKGDSGEGEYSKEDEDKWYGYEANQHE